MSTTQHNQARIVVIDEGHEGQRIDNFLLGHLKGVPKTHIYRILRKGEVRLNKGRVKANQRLARGDQVRIPPIRLAEPSPTGQAKPPQRLLRLIDESILYEEKNFLILNKPSGIAVHGGSGLSFGVIELMRALRPDAPYLELVHRLDRETSGCLIIAKRRSALRAFHELLRSGGMDKRYLALVKGEWRGGERRIDAPLRKNQLRSGERIVTVDDEGKASLSIFRPRHRFREATLMEVELITGRTHQVRVHSAHAGHPIAGDEKYGDELFNRSMKRLGLGRLFLHAAELSFRLGEEGGTVRVEAPLDEQLTLFLEQLK